MTNGNKLLFNMINLRYQIVVYVDNIISFSNLIFTKKKKKIK